MASLQVLLACALIATSWAAPQFGVLDDQPPTPYEFEYGVNVEETGDVKEHKETVSASGRTDGEYRWLQPNGLFMVVRYYVDGDSGFVAEVSEEPGSPVEARYVNSISQESAATNTAGATQSFAKSIDVIPSNIGAAVNTISAPRVTLNRQSVSRPRPRPATINRGNVRFNQQQAFTTNSINQQPQTLTSGGFIDGGIIDGGIIDGGIIDGGIIDGGIINADEFDAFDDDSREDSQTVILAARNPFRGLRG